MIPYQINAPVPAFYAGAGDFFICGPAFFCQSTQIMLQWRYQQPRRKLQCMM